MSMELLDLVFRHSNEKGDKPIQMMRFYTTGVVRKMIEKYLKL